MELDNIKSFTLHSNNKMSIILTKNAKTQHQIKQINIQYHYVKKLVNKRKFTIK